MCHMLKHFIHMKYFNRWLVLLSFLYIELALVCWRNTGPPARSPCNPTNCEVAQLSNDAVGAARGSPDGEQTKTALWLWVREITWYLYTRGVRRRMRAKKNADFKLLCREWFHRVRHHVHDGHCTGEFAKVIWRLGSFTVSFRGCPRRIRPKKPRLSQSENSEMDTWPIYKNYSASLFRKFAFYKILIHVLIL